MSRNPYFKAMVERHQADRESGVAEKYWNASHTLWCWSDWVEQEFKPWWERHHPRPLCIDGRQYRRRKRGHKG
jgi:hypothetical protein